MGKIQDMMKSFMDQQKQSQSAVPQSTSSGTSMASTSNTAAPKRRETEQTRYPHLTRRSDNLVKEVQRRLKAVTSHEEFRALLAIIRNETIDDLKKHNLDICPIPWDTNDFPQGRACRFYQYNGSLVGKNCNLAYIHTDPVKKHKHREHAGDPNYYVHCCMLCQFIRRGNCQHPLYFCDFLRDLTCYLEDPTEYVPKFMVITTYEPDNENPKPQSELSDNE